MTFATRTLLLLAAGLLVGPLACSDNGESTSPDAGDGSIRLEAGPDHGTVDKGPDRALVDGVSLDRAKSDGSSSEFGPDANTKEGGAKELGLDKAKDQVAEGAKDLAASDLSVDQVLPDKGPPTVAHGQCKSPKTLTFQSGVATITDDTSTSANEFGTSILCGTAYDFDGPQLYYKVNLTAGTTYKVTLTPSSTFDPALYAFKASAGCSASAMDAACKNAISEIYGYGSAGVEYLTLAPTTTEDWILVVDAYSPNEYGSFTLEVEEFTLPAHSACNGAKVLTFTSGKASVIEDTSKSQNEFSSSITCGFAYKSFPGSQLYYQVSLSAGQTYRITLAVSYAFAYAYIFQAASCSSASAINTDCKSSGLSGDVLGAVPSGGSGSMYFKAPSSGDYIVAVDSSSASHAGLFTLTVETFTAASNGKCSAATALTFTSGKATVTGDTAGVADEYATLKCGGSTALTGPQVYYTFTAKAKQTYKVALEPQFGAYLTLFAKTSCGSATLMETDCASLGKTGAASGYIAAVSGSSGGGALYFTPAAAGDLLVGVDSASSTVYGPFTLTVEEFTPASNGTCGQATALTLSNGKASVSGQTSGVADEYSTLKCGGTTLAGPQVYYSFSAKSGQTYVATLSPQFAAALVAFPKSSCGNASQMSTDCSSQGKTGEVITVPKGSAGTLYITPSSAVTMVLGVDSIGPVQSGTFALTVAEHTVPTVTAPLTWDFESSCMNLAATLDWECGPLAFKKGSGCNAVVIPPKAAHSGTTLWGTKLNDCYSPLGNNGETNCTATSVTDDSILSFKVALPSAWTQATLTYYAWDDSLVPSDYSEVRLDGQSVTAENTCQKTTYSAPTAWVKHSIDLSTWVGKTVTVAFHFSASATGNNAGLYLDDIAVAGK